MIMKTNFLGSVFISELGNKFFPHIISGRALFFYAILTIFCLILIAHPIELKINKFLADLTQELIIEEINPVRISNGFPELSPNEKLTKAAELKARDMIDKNYFSHTGPNQEPPWIWLDSVGYNYAAAGENLAIDVCNPEVLKDAWLASPSHAKNILNGYFTDIGISVAKGKINGKETTVVVMFLGREISPEFEKAAFSQTENKPADLLVTPEELIKYVPPGEVMVVKTIEEDEGVVEAGTQDEKLWAYISAKKTEKNGSSSILLFLINKFPKMLRTLLTIFYSLLIFWLIINLILRKQKTSFLIFRSLILLIFLFCLWLKP